MSTSTLPSAMLRLVSLQLMSFYFSIQAAYAAAAHRTNDAVLSLGTSLQLSVPIGVAEPPPVGAVDLFPYDDERHLLVAASLNGGNVIDAFASVSIAQKSTTVKRRMQMLLKWLQSLSIEHNFTQSDLCGKLLELAVDAE